MPTLSAQLQIADSTNHDTTEAGGRYESESQAPTGRVMNKTKTIAFFRVYLLTNGQRQDLKNVNWRDQLDGINALPWSERTAEGMVFDPQFDDDHVIVGIHRPIKKEFMSLLDSTTESISDLLSNDEDDHGLLLGEPDEDPGDDAGVVEKPKAPDFANSTAVLFMPIGNVVALALGSTSSPRHSSVVTFLDALVPQAKGTHWAIEPLMDTDQIQILQNEAEGAVEFSTKFSTVRTLFTPDSSSGFVTYIDKIADSLGADVEVEIRIKLAPEARSLATRTRFLSSIQRALPRVSQKANKTKARVILPSGLEEELDLVTHRLASTVDVDEKTSESRRFSALVGHLRVVSGEMEARVKRLVEGTSDEEEAASGS